MKDALETLRQATRRYLKTEAAHNAARTDVIYETVEALRAGARPTDVTAASPFEAAYVRRLARKNGIKPERKRSTQQAPEPPPTPEGEKAWPSSATGTTEHTSSSPTS